MSWPNAPSPTPEIAGMAGFPVALATCPAKTAELWWAKTVTPALEPLLAAPLPVYSQMMALSGAGLADRASVRGAERGIDLGRGRTLRSRRCRSRGWRCSTETRCSTALPWSASRRTWRTWNWTQAERSPSYSQPGPSRRPTHPGAGRQPGPSASGMSLFPLLVCAGKRSEYGYGWGLASGWTSWENQSCGALPSLRSLCAERITPWLHPGNTPGQSGAVVGDPRL